jgi:hypothetical protein
MTIRELIAKLGKLDDLDREALVHVRVHTQAFQVAQVTPFEVDYGGIWISLPNNMHVVERRR